jgi:hypothetical protein
MRPPRRPAARTRTTNRTPSVSGTAAAARLIAERQQPRTPAKNGQKRPRHPLECGGPTPLSYTRSVPPTHRLCCTNGRARVYPYGLPVWGLLPSHGGRRERTRGGQNRPKRPQLRLHMRPAGRPGQRGGFQSLARTPAAHRPRPAESGHSPRASCPGRLALGPLPFAPTPPPRTKPAIRATAVPRPPGPLLFALCAPQEPHRQDFA